MGCDRLAGREIVAMARPLVISYSLAFPIEVARVCPEPCAFCPYPLGGREWLMSLGSVAKEIARAGQLGATMIDLVAGDQVGRIPEVQVELERERAHSFCEYLVRCSEIVRHGAAARSFPIRLDIGPLDEDEWSKISRHFAGARLLLTTVDPRVVRSGALKGCSTQSPELRLKSIIDAADAPVPLTTGTMIGIGESRSSREKAIRVLAEVARRYGHIQSVLLQAFRPHPATRMSDYPPTPLSDILDTVALACHYLPPLVRIQANALDWRDHLTELIEAGVNDLGDLNLRVLSARGQNVDKELSHLLKPLENASYELKRRSVLGQTALRLSQEDDSSSPLEPIETRR